MINTSKPIVFFGSGSVASKSLELLAEKFNIEAIITKPQQTSSRDPVPVIDLAKKLNIKYYTPSTKADLDSLFDKNRFVSDFGILIDFGIIVSQKIIDYFNNGIVNSHFSLLPRWRGADPISFSILNGDKNSGVSLMLVSSGVDEGQLIAQDKLKIDSIDSIELTQSLIKMSNSMLVKYIPKYLSNSLHPQPQPINISPTFSRKLTKKDGVIDWNKSAEQIEREIRAFIQWPKSTTQMFGIQLIITEAIVVSSQGAPGSIKFDKKSLVVNCGVSSLSILKLKPAGRNEMSISSFIGGYENKFNN